MKTKLTIATLAMFLSTSIARADLMLEPYIGYESGQTTTIHSTLGDLSAKTGGLQGGLRVGYSFPLLFWTALDYSLVPSGTSRPDLIGSNYNYKRSDLYLAAGVDLPILLRVWAGYGLQNSLTEQKSGGDVVHKGGTNYKLGVGLTMLPLVTVYLEMYQHKFADSEANGVTNYLGGNSAQDGGWTLGASFPIEL